MIMKELIKNNEILFRNETNRRLSIKSMMCRKKVIDHPDYSSGVN